MQYNGQRQYVKRATIKQEKSGKNGQSQARMGKIGQRRPGNKVRYAKSKKPKILFSILTLVKNNYIEVLPDKNSNLQWCESLVVFRFFT